jgi:hypothetical protein
LGPKQNLHTFSLKDSILVESSSQSASSQSSRQEELNRATVLDIFDDTQVYRFYSEGKFSIGGFFKILSSSSFIPLDEVNYSWLDKDLGIEDVPKMSSSDLVNYLRSEIKV